MNTLFRRDPTRTDNTIISVISLSGEGERGGGRGGGGGGGGGDGGGEEE